MGKSADNKPITPHDGAWYQVIARERAAGHVYPRKPRVVVTTFKKVFHAKAG